MVLVLSDLASRGNSRVFLHIFYQQTHCKTTNLFQAFSKLGRSAKKRRSEKNEREAWCEEHLPAPRFSLSFSCASFRAALKVSERLEKV